MSEIIVLGQIGQRTILNRGGSYQPFVVVSGYNKNRGDWMYGDYFQTFQGAVVYALAELGEETPTDVQMQRISRHYQIANLADFLEENYRLDRQDCWDWATEIRRLMLEDELSEEQAIEETKEGYLCN